LTGQLERYPIAPNASIEAALEPVKLFERLAEGCRDVGSRFTIEPICLD